MKHTATSLLKVMGFLILFLMPTTATHAQSRKIKFGKPSYEELRMTVYEPDRDADAVFLHESTTIGYELENDRLKLVRTHEYRIKVLKESGKEWGTVSLPFREDGAARETFTELKACAVNMAGGRQVKTEVQKGQMTDEKMGEGLYNKKFEIPDVRVGTVIDVKYKLESDFPGNIPSVDLQHAIPVKYSYFEMGQPEFMTFNIVARGLIPTNIRKTIKETPVKGEPDLTYLTEYTVNEQEDIPALRPAEHIYGPNDYTLGFDYELSAIQYFDIFDHVFSSTWLDFCTTLSENELFGGAMKTKNPLADEVEQLRHADLSELQKIDRLMRAVQGRVEWDGTHSLLASQSLEKVLAAGKGNSADMNFLLYCAIKDLGHLVFPLMVNPRPMGRMPIGKPMKGKVNAFVLCIKTDENTFYFADASDKHSFVNVIPPTLLVDNAHFYSLNGEPSPVSLANKTKNTAIYQLDFTLDEKGRAWKGSMKSRLTNNEAYENRKAMGTFFSEDEFIGRFAETHGLMSMTDYSRTEDVSAVITEEFCFEKEIDFEKKIDFENEMEGAGRIEVEPLLSLVNFGVTLAEGDRQLPVEFDFPRTVTVLSTVTIPEGWTIEATPEPAILSFKNKDITFAMNSNAVGNTITTSFKYSLDRTFFSNEDYADLAEFFGMLAKKLHQKIILMQP